ncbi:MAG: ThiF family adenylyltransferase [Candidatus Thiodiazotropha sp.]
MNYSEIVKYLTNKGYEASLEDTDSDQWLSVTHKFDGKLIRLSHFCTEELSTVPRFLLCDLAEHGNIAHVLPISGSLGSVCVGDQDSVSVNYERPELAFEESLKRHIDLLTKAITDTKWNEQEQLREFYSNWLMICDRKATDFLCAASGDFEEIQVLSPVPKRRWGFESKYLGITSSAPELADFSYISQQGKNRIKAGAGYVIPLDVLRPAPSSRSELEGWYLRAIDENDIPPACAQKKSREFWLIFNAETPSGRTWFGVALGYKSNAKKTLPKTKERMKNWSITPLRVKVFNKDRLMPRSGADLGLEKKSVLLVGCGSVGGEIAYKLGAAGVGKLVLIDPDEYSIDNIYRHVLSDRYIGCNKALALSFSLDSKYPWISTQFDNKRLLNLRNKAYLEKFDSVVIAIGAPTHERKFHDFLVEEDVNVPVVNTWLEGYGIGGHAVLDVRDSHGCLRCAYVDQQNGGRGLASNLNFLDPNQDLTVNHAGCGELFLPYNAVSAAQTALIASNLAIGSLLGKITTGFYPDSTDG